MTRRMRLAARDKPTKEPSVTALLKAALVTTALAVGCAWAASWIAKQTVPSSSSPPSEWSEFSRQQTTPRLRWAAEARGGSGGGSGAEGPSRVNLTRWRVPSTIHQTWKNSTVPPWAEEAVASWKVCERPANPAGAGGRLAGSLTNKQADAAAWRVDP